VDDSGSWHIKQIVNGDRNSDVLGYVKYNSNNLLTVFESELIQAQRIINYPGRMQRRY
jgi:arginine decarboxylase-like protein